MSYCGICDNHNVRFETVEDGYYCSGCDEIHYHDDLEREHVNKMLTLLPSLKKEGWKRYPNCDFMGEPIDEVIEEYKQKAQRLGITI